VLLEALVAVNFRLLLAVIVPRMHAMSRLFVPPRYKDFSGNHLLVT